MPDQLSSSFQEGTSQGVRQLPVSHSRKLIRLAALGCVALVGGLSGCANQPKPEASAATGAAASSPAPTKGGSFSISGAIDNLRDFGFFLQLNKQEVLDVFNGSNRFSFKQKLPQGAPYEVKVLQQPLRQSCEVRNGSGVVQADVTDIFIQCYFVLSDPSKASSKARRKATPEAATSAPAP